jgi:hypothetical protein
VRAASSVRKLLYYCSNLPGLELTSGSIPFKNEHAINAQTKTWEPRTNHTTHHEPLHFFEFAVIPRRERHEGNRAGWSARALSPVSNKYKSCGSASRTGGVRRSGPALLKDTIETPTWIFRTRQPTAIFTMHDSDSRADCLESTAESAAVKRTDS